MAGRRLGAEDAGGGGGGLPPSVKRLGPSFFGALDTSSTQHRLGVGCWGLLVSATCDLCDGLHVCVCGRRWAAEMVPLHCHRPLGFHWLTPTVAISTKWKRRQLTACSL